MVRAVTVTVTVTSATASSEPANQNPGAAWHHEDSSGVPGDEGHSGRVGDTSHTSSQAHLGLHQGTRPSGMLISFPSLCIYYMKYFVLLSVLG